MFSIGMDTWETLSDIQQYKDTFNGRWNFGLDITGQLNQTYNTFYYPYMFLLDGDRIIVEEWIGLTDSEADNILLVLDNYVEGLDGSFGRKLDIPISFSFASFLAILIARRRE